MPPRPLKTPYKTEELNETFSVDGVPRALVNPCRKIVFTIESKDQGWGGDADDENSFHGSWTWFEAGVERLDKVNTRKCTKPTQQSAQRPGTEGARSLYRLRKLSRQAHKRCLHK